MKSNRREWVIGPEMTGERLDRALARLAPDWSRTWLQRQVRDGGVQVNGVPVTLPRLLLEPGMVVALEIPEAEKRELSAEAFEFPILFEDEWMLVINKPAGVVVHPAAGNRTGTVVNALLGRYPELGALAEETGDRPGIVHRLDKDTSGCLMVAKTPQAMFRLTAALAAREVHKTYLALVRGEVRKNTEKLVSLIGRHPVQRQKMAVVPRNGKEAVTLYRKIDVMTSGREKGTLLEVDILTGRTHQIRVHLASIGHPVLGDGTYGGKSEAFPAARQMLHAWRIDFPHPISGKRICCRAPVPEDMWTWMQRMEAATAYE